MEIISGAHRAMVTGVCRLHTADGKLTAWFPVCEWPQKRLEYEGEKIK